MILYDPFHFVDSALLVLKFLSLSHLNTISVTRTSDSTIEVAFNG